MNQKGVRVSCISAKEYFINNRFRFFVLIPVLFFLSVSSAQKRQPGHPALHRCGTMEAIKREIQKDPVLRARILQGEIDYQNSLNIKMKPGAGNTLPVVASLPGPVTIPVVVHIVLRNPWVITDESVQHFIDRLNLDYSGLNPDSTNAERFYPVRGHSLLRFVLARRDINGNFTTGIVRKVGSTEIAQDNPQPVKNSATPTGGSTGWDVTKYYNLYVLDGGISNILGIAPTIGPGGAAGSTNADGVCIDYRSFSDACFSFEQFNMGRTAVHEIGHNFGLYHPFDDGCATNDFAQLQSPGCSLPPQLLAPADDVPHQSDNTSGCPQPGVTNGCNGTAKMFQNYMDYTDDACYSMFSKGSVDRMEWVLENCRKGYLTTLGGTYPDNMQVLDAGIYEVASPGFDFDTLNCRTIRYPAVTCAGNFTPRLRIVNAGTDTLRSITVNATINSGVSVSKTFDLRLGTGKTQVLSLPDLFAIAGNNYLQFTLFSPNNSLDGNNKNDTISTNFLVGNAITLPYSQNFESIIFPPADGTVIINPDEPELTWERTTLAGNPGAASMRVNCFDYGPDNNQRVGQRDIYRLPPVKAKLVDSIAISFNVAYRQYFGSDVQVPSKDSLRIIYSNDCGNTWFPTNYAKGGASLNTVGGTTGQAFVPTASQWRKDSVVINNLCAKNVEDLIIGFESVNNYGNNIYVDNISIVGFNSFPRNAILKSVNQPLPAICSLSVAPEVTFGNDGLDTIRSLKINYQVDNDDIITYNWVGSIGKCDSVKLTLAPVNAAVGTHTIKVFIAEPNGGSDSWLKNDTLQKTFSIYSTAATPVKEDFEDNNFPRTNWGVQNVNGGTTWQRSTSTAQSGIGALWINNPNAANSNGAIDYFISPIVLNSNTFDSVFLDFDLAYKSGSRYPGSTTFALDTLEVLATKDCGASFTSVWKKWGADLQTLDDPNYSYSIPFIPSIKEEWKKQRAYLTPFVGAESFQLYFLARGNRQNNIWIDNINIYSQTLPKRLKQQGYLIYPNPFSSSFLIHHYAPEPPVSLQSVQVYSSSGQLVWSSVYHGNAERQISVNMSNAAKGLYILKLFYTTKTIVERIVKH